MKRLILLTILSGMLSPALAQRGLRQYFDGADTMIGRSLFMDRDTSAENIWHAGMPYKTIFNRAATVPNAMLTDTAAPYPAGNISRFTFRFKDSSFLYGPGGLVAIRWVQKLDMEKGRTGGVVEFSKNGGDWQNIFNNPSVYRLFGFAQANKDTLFDGQYAFSGRDTLWRDIWFCIQGSSSDSFAVRFTFISDSGVSGREGWMIDNMLAEPTFSHTVGTVGTGNAAKVYPTSTSGSLIIEAEHRSTNHYITGVRITDVAGRLMREYHDQQTRYILDIGSFPDGRYNVLVTTNLTREAFPVLVHH